MHADDMRVPQRCGQFGLAVEPFTEIGVRCYRLGHHFQSVTSRQPGMLSKIDLSHPARTQQLQDGVSSKSRPDRYRHAPNSTAAACDRGPESVAQSAVSLFVEATRRGGSKSLGRNPVSDPSGYMRGGACFGNMLGYQCDG